MQGLIGGLPVARFKYEQNYTSERNKIAAGSFVSREMHDTRNVVEGHRAINGLDSDLLQGNDA
jgi:hypothetical protein